MAAAHDCDLFKKVRACVIDGKWSVQTAVCNDRISGVTWDADLRLGYFRGCEARRHPGSKYCRRHSQSRLPPEATRIAGHREVAAEQGVELQYKVDNAWVAAAAVPLEQARAYVLTLLRPQTRASLLADPDSCPALASSFLLVSCVAGHKDDRKGIPETAITRKSNGILVAVSPCLQILAIRPTYASESVTQVLFLAQHLLALFSTLAYIIYDNACGAARTVARKLRDPNTSGPQRVAWERLAALHWVVDRLHLRYHSACRDASSGWFVPGVDPADHAVLRGVNTEAAEQVFHIAGRRQLVLSYAAPTHQEIFLLLFAHAHNIRHTCDKASNSYVAAQHASSAAVTTSTAPTEAAPAKQLLVCCQPPNGSGRGQSVL